MKRKILVLLGSTKSGSSNGKIVQIFVENTSPYFAVEIAEIELLPFFNPDLENDLLPEIVTNFLQKIKEAAGVLICTPEYVFSVPGVLKNALEWTVATTVFADKPVSIITAAASGEIAHKSIKLIMKTLGTKVTKDCAILIKSPKSKINDEGKITDKELLLQIDKLIAKFKKLTNAK